MITPTANHPGATIRIVVDDKENGGDQGIVVPSGQASDLLELIHVEQDVKIEVTAQMCIRDRLQPEGDYRYIRGSFRYPQDEGQYSL